MTNQPDSAEMDQQDPMPDQEDQQPSTVELPLSAFDGAKEGQMLTLKVISVDADNGVINAAPVTEASASEGGSDSMAADLKPE